MDPSAIAVRLVSHDKGNRVPLTFFRMQFSLSKPGMTTPVAASRTATMMYAAQPMSLYDRSIGSAVYVMSSCKYS